MWPRWPGRYILLSQIYQIPCFNPQLKDYSYRDLVIVRVDTFYIKPLSSMVETYIYKFDIWQLEYLKATGCT